MAIDSVLQPLINLSKLTSDELRLAIKKYNLIIHMNMNTIDTTNYNIADNNTSNIAPAQTTVTITQRGGAVILAKNTIGSQNITTMADGDEVIVIPIKQIRKITVKSLRSFLKNQEEIKVKA